MGGGIAHREEAHREEAPQRVPVHRVRQLGEEEDGVSDRPPRVPAEPRLPAASSRLVPPTVLASGATPLGIGPRAGRDEPHQAGALHPAATACRSALRRLRAQCRRRACRRRPRQLWCLRCRWRHWLWGCCGRRWLLSCCGLRRLLGCCGRRRLLGCCGRRWLLGCRWHLILIAFVTTVDEVDQHRHGPEVSSGLRTTHQSQEHTVAEHQRIIRRVGRILCFEFIKYKPLSQHTGTTRARTGADWHTHRLTTGAA